MGKGASKILPGIECRGNDHGYFEDRMAESRSGSPLLATAQPPAGERSHFVHPAGIRGRRSLCLLDDNIRSGNANRGTGGMTSVSRPGLRSKTEDFEPAANGAVAATRAAPELRKRREKL